MAKHKFTTGNKFGGRSPGRPRVSDEVKAARKFTQPEFELAVSKIFFITMKDLQRLVNSQETPVMEALIARIALNGMKKGSTQELNYFIERFFGKVAENHNFTGNAHPDLVSYIQKINAEHARNEETNGSENKKSNKENDSKKASSKDGNKKDDFGDWC